MTTQRWGVVGGGMLGMTLALWLRDRGHEVTIIEASDNLGGLASPWDLGDVTWDKHYHVILSTDAHLLGILDRLGLTEELHWVETKTGVYSGGRLYSVSNAIEYLRFPPLRLIDKARMAWTILYGSRYKNWKRLEQLSVEKWLRKHSGDRAFEKFWLPLLRSKLGDNYRKTSAAFIWTTIQRLYAARRSGLKRELFGYVSGGYARILERFAEVLQEAGVKSALNAAVSSIHESSAAFSVTTGDSAYQFDRVVVTAASPIAARLIQGLSGAEKERMTGVEYQGIVCASMLTDRGLGGFYVTNITDEVPFTGIIEMSALVDRSEFGGRHLIYLPRYTDPGDEILKMPDDEVEERFVDATSKIFPEFSPSDVRAFRVSRVTHVFPIPTIGYSERIPPVVTSVPGVFSVNSAHILNGTLNVNETIQLATRAFPVLVGDAEFGSDTLQAPVQPRSFGA